MLMAGLMLECINMVSYSKNISVTVSLLIGFCITCECCTFFLYYSTWYSLKLKEVLFSVHLQKKKSLILMPPLIIMLALHILVGPLMVFLVKSIPTLNALTSTMLFWWCTMVWLFLSIVYLTMFDQVSLNKS